MVALANVCAFNLADETLEMYDLILAGLGYQKATLAISKIIATRESKAPFPSASEIIAVSQDRISPAGMAVEIADKVWNAVERFGWNNRLRAEEWVGPIGKAVIDRVSWGALCEAPSSQATSVKAQLRNTAQSVLERVRQESAQSLLSHTEQASIESKPVIP